MRVKVIGENDCARAVRGLLRKAGLAVTEVMPAELLKLGQGPAAGYVVRIEQSNEPLIHFDSVDCELEAKILRHVTQLSARPVVVDRPGGQVHSDREIRIVVPPAAAGDAAAAVAVEFGVLRGLIEVIHQPRTAPARSGPPWYRRFFGG